MLKRHLAPVLALVLPLAQAANAFIDPPYVTPEHPVAGEAVSVNIRAGICDAILTGVVPPQVTQEGNAIRILFWSARDYDPVFCNSPVGTTTHEVGVYPPGSYTLQVDRFDHLLVSGEPAIETLGIIPFTVTGGTIAPVSAPASSVAGLGSLALGLVGLAVWMLRSRLGHKHYAASVLALFSLFVPSAHAFYDPPYITPEQPIAGETISVNIRGGICDAIIGISGYPQITQNGNSIRILFWSVRNYDPIFCNYPVGTGVFGVGTYPPGSYTLQVDRFDHLLVSGEPAAETLGIIPFTVTGGTIAPVSAPASSVAGLGSLALGIVGLAVWMLRSRLGRKHYAASVLALVFSLFVQSAYAFYDPPWITPEHPIASDTIAVNIHCGICDTIAGGIPGYPQITQEGNAIRILFWSVHYDDFEFCNLPVGTGTYAVGAYPPGSYTLRVDRFDHLLVSGEPAAETLGIIPFTVTGGATAPVSAPVSSVAGLGSLALGLIALAVVTLRTRRPGLLIVALCVLPVASRAQDAPDRVLELLVTTAPGAPAAARTMTVRHSQTV